MQPCIFCPNPRTRKRGEHIWDDWLNRENGKNVGLPGSVMHTGIDSAVIREYPTRGLDVTLPFVCDRCNNTWMSDLSSEAKDRLEPIIRRDKPTDFDATDIVTITAFAFLKSAILDWAIEDKRRPCISRTACIAFKHSLTDPASDGLVLPDGLQVWIAAYRRARAMEAQTFSDELSGVAPYKGYTILVITYVVGSFIFQLTFPKWSRSPRNRPDAPFFDVIGDMHSVPIWPDVDIAYWPPPAHVHSSALQSFRQRFRQVRVKRPLSL
jgi:hypothetical protein